MSGESEEGPEVRLTTGEVAEVLGVPYGTLAQWIRDDLVGVGEIKTHKINRYLFDYPATFAALVVAELRRLGMRPRKASSVVYGMLQGGRRPLWEIGALVVMRPNGTSLRVDLAGMHARLKERLAQIGQ